MTQHEANNNDIFNALTANMELHDDVPTKVTSELQGVQEELIEALDLYCRNPLPAHYDDAHDAIYDTVNVLAEAIPDIFEAVQNADERIVVLAGLSDVLALQRLEGFSGILPSRYTIFDNRTAGDKIEYRDGLRFLLDGKNVLGEDRFNTDQQDTMTMIVDIGRMLCSELHEDIDDFYRRANINEPDVTPPKVQ